MTATRSNGTDGNANLIGTDGDDTFNLTKGNDTLDGRGGNDWLRIYQHILYGTDLIEVDIKVELDAGRWPLETLPRSCAVSKMSLSFVTTRTRAASLLA